MTLRSPTERVLQTLSFEAVGLCLSIPLCMVLNKAEASDTTALMTAVTLAVLVWSPLHNTLFDLADLRRTGRLASQRPRALRVLHALSHEVSSVAVTLPIMMLLGGYGLHEALTTNLVLTLFYAAYAFVFHLVYDRLRPVVAAEMTAVDLCAETALPAPAPFAGQPIAA